MSDVIWMYGNNCHGKNLLSKKSYAILSLIFWYREKRAAFLHAVVVVFGRDVQNKRCFYHLTQSTWRKIQALGFAATYNTDEHFRHFVGMMDDLAFLPVEEVDAGMALWTIVPPAANELLQYFDDTYVSGILRHQPFDGADGAMVHHFNRRPTMTC